MSEMKERIILIHICLFAMILYWIFLAGCRQVPTPELQPIGASFDSYLTSRIPATCGEVAPCSAQIRKEK